MDEEREQTVRARIREWWRLQIADKDEVDITALAEEAAQELVDDPEFRARYLEETVQPLIYNIGIAVVGDSRPIGKRTVRGAQIAAVMAARAATIAGAEVKWSRWLVHDPLSHRHVSLLNMSKKQVLAASEERFRAAATDAHVGGFLRMVAGRLDDLHTVGEVWREDELEELQLRLEVGEPLVTLVPIGAGGSNDEEE